MTRLRTIVALLLCLLWGISAARAQGEAESGIEVYPLGSEGSLEYDFARNAVVATNGVRAVYGGVGLTANSATVDLSTGDVVAEGRVRILRDEQVWASEHIRYNFKTRSIAAEEFRTGRAPIFAQGTQLSGDTSNAVYTATGGYITTDDVAEPSLKVRSRRMVIVPGVRVVAYDAVLYLKGVPVFYFPYFSRNLGGRMNNINLVPGYRSAYGPYILGSYTWFPSSTTNVDGVARLDYRERRGPGAGMDVNTHFGEWGEGRAKYYYMRDLEPSAGMDGPPLPEGDRQRLVLTYQANPATNLQALAVVRYQSDTNFLRDFFEREYSQNPQPSTYVELNKFWQNFSLDVYVQPRLNDFFETVERLPEVRLTGFRQQVGASPLYYESQSSVGYYRRLFAELDSPSGTDNFESARADTYQQLLLPMSFFGWLSVVPHAGGRFTYYSEGVAPSSESDISRGVFDTGVELSMKASRLWPEVQSRTFEVNGLRHIVEPSLNYVFVPEPNYTSAEVPQFDYRFPSLRLLPIEFLSDNAIDSIGARNVLRPGLRNKLQTKRAGEVSDLLDWSVFVDWRLDREPGETLFSDVYSDLVLRPRSWLLLESMSRYDVEDGLWRMAYHAATIQPNDRWSWGIGHFYLRDDNLEPPTGLGAGNNSLTSTMFYRISHNWGLRAAHQFDIRESRMQAQSYSIYRDLRIWTVALTFRLIDNLQGPEDFSFAFTFSLKAFPRFGLGTETVRGYSLLGG
jgi:LPS-assembly protein